VDYPTAAQQRAGLKQRRYLDAPTQGVAVIEDVQIKRLVQLFGQEQKPVHQ
jgi:hypothetical protein